MHPADVFELVTAQRTGQPSIGAVVQPVGDEAGRVHVSWFFAFLHARGDVPTNPVPRGLPTRRERQRPHQGVPIVRGVRRLPRILAPAEVDALMGALRTHRDRAMVAAMVLGGLRRCEVLGLRLDDLRVAERRVFIAEGRGGYQRLVPWCRCRTRSQTAGTLGDEPAAGVTIVFSRVFVRRRQPPACKKEPIQRPPNAARARSIV